MHSMKLLSAALFVSFVTIRAQTLPTDIPPADSVILYVSATRGNDAWTGRLSHSNPHRTDGPLATLDGARRAVRAIDKTGISEVRVLFREGTYYLASTVDFTLADSGTPNTSIVYQSYPGEWPVFTGGARVLNWVNIGGNEWKAALPASTQYFENLFYNGDRRLRPRLGGYLGEYYHFAKPVILDANEASLPQNVQNCAVRIDANHFECFDRFRYISGDPIAQISKNLAPVAGNNCGQNPGNPALAGDVEVLDFEQFSTSKLRISCIDTTNEIVYLTGPTTEPQSNYTEDGFQAGRRYLVENVEDALTEPGQWFLDRSVPNSLVLYYLAGRGENPNIDTVTIPQTAPPLLRTSNLSYVTFRGLAFEYDNSTLAFGGHPSRELEVDIPPVISIQNSQYVTFDSGVIRHASGAGLEILSCLPANPTQTPPPLNSPPAWCSYVGTDVVTTHNSVTNSAFYDVGALGMRIGLPWVPDETDGNIPQWTAVTNNVVEGYGRIIPASFGIGQGLGHDNSYLHNDVYDGYHCAISISTQTNVAPDPPGNADNTISFNHVHDLLQGIMSDGGAIRIESGNSKGTAPGNRIWNNRIHDVSDSSAQLDADGYGGDGIYLDNSTGAVDVENNLVYRVSDTAVYSPHGPAQLSNGDRNTTHPIIVKNNILAFARTAMIGVNFPYADGETVPNLAFVLSNNLMYFDRNGASAGQAFYVQGECTYTNGLAFPDFEAFSSNLYWRTDGTFAHDGHAFHQQVTPKPDAHNPPCANDAATDTGLWQFYRFSTQWQKPPLNEDTGSVIGDPEFLLPFFPFDNYMLLHGSPGVGFVPFDPNDAGREFHFFDPPPVAPTFVTAPYNPWTDF